MIFFAIYDRTGRIHATGGTSTPNIAAMQARVGLSVYTAASLGGLNDETGWIENAADDDAPKVLSARPTVNIPSPVIVPVGVGAMVVSPPLPEGTQVTANGGPVALSANGEIVHTPDEAGTWVYGVALPFPYRAAEPLTVIVEA